MNTWIYILGGIGTLLTGAATAWVLLRKMPVENRRITVDINGASVLIAAGLRDDAIEDRESARTDRNVALQDLAEFRAEFDQYRRDTDARLAEMSIEVRAARAGEVEAKRQAQTYREENTVLRGRVDELEREVTQLKANGSA